jgi:hypothetical protein
MMNVVVLFKENESTISRAQSQMSIPLKFSSLYKMPLLFSYLIFQEINNDISIAVKSISIGLTG